MTDLIDPVVTYPLPLASLRTFLLSRTEITAIVGTRISDAMPAATASPRWPALRLSVQSSGPTTPHRRIDALFQIDCWAVNQPSADRLASKVVSVLEAVRQFDTGDAFFDHASTLRWRSDPDETISPAQPRSIVTGRIRLTPHP